MGRPPKWKTTAELEAAVDGYFDGVDGLPTVSGLCLHLDCCRDTLWEYAKKPEFSDAIKRARTRLELAWEKRLGENSCTGAIFWLKNQGWKDTHTLAGDKDNPLEIVGKFKLAPLE